MASPSREVPVIAPESDEAPEIERVRNVIDRYAADIAQRRARVRAELLIGALLTGLSLLAILAGMSARTSPLLGSLIVTGAGLTLTAVACHGVGRWWEVRGDRRRLELLEFARKPRRIVVASSPSVSIPIQSSGESR